MTSSKQVKNICTSPVVGCTPLIPTQAGRSWNSRPHGSTEQVPEQLRHREILSWGQKKFKKEATRHPYYKNATISYHILDIL